MTFLDRRDAGRQLAALLRTVDPSLAATSSATTAVTTTTPPAAGTVVMGMARGGVPVGFEVARQLGAALEVVVVRKLGHPRQPELGLGAIAEDGVRLVNAELVEKLDVDQDTIDSVTARETVELERRVAAYRGDRPALSVEGRSAIVVDDGLATGFTARAAVEVMRGRGAARVVVAVPVGPPATLEALGAVADDVVCVEPTKRFVGISEWYEDFHQVSDEEVARLLADAAAGAW